MGGLWIPDAIHRPIPAGDNDPQIITIGAVFHVAASTAASLHDYFDGPSGGIESTGYIRFDGTIEQYRPLNIECDAQWSGNSWTSGGHRYGLNSWESQGIGDGTWTPQQLAAIKKIITFTHRHHDAPLRRNPGPHAAGFGYHCLFDAWNHNAHSCPGPRRVNQFNHTIVPWMRQGGSEEDMPYTDWPRADRDALVHDIADEVLRGIGITNRNPDGSHGKTRSLAATITDIEATQDKQGKRILRILRKVNQR